MLQAAMLLHATHHLAMLLNATPLRAILPHAMRLHATHRHNSGMNFLTRKGSFFALPFFIEACSEVF